MILDGFVMSDSWIGAGFYILVAHVLENHMHLVTCFEKSYFIVIHFDKLYLTAA